MATAVPVPCGRSLTNLCVVCKCISSGGALRVADRLRQCCKRLIACPEQMIFKVPFTDSPYSYSPLRNTSLPPVRCPTSADTHSAGHSAHDLFILTRNCILTPRPAAQACPGALPKLSRHTQRNTTHCVYSLAAVFILPAPQHQLAAHALPALESSNVVARAARQRILALTCV